jgi:hypothetical protein
MEIHSVKDTPIFILNKDRLDCTKLLVESLQKRNYCNITIIDNLSTYEPLLEWYPKSGTNVFINNVAGTCNGALYFLAIQHKLQPFADAVNNGWYVYTDSDTVPIDEAPQDFIENMIEVGEKHAGHKIGMGIKIDDLPDTFYKKEEVIKHESIFWGPLGIIEGEKMPVYRGPTDTTFAIYRPGTHPLQGTTATGVRTGHPYLVKHIPWYYDYNKLPEDEVYYLKHLDVNWTHWSQHAKSLVK